MAEEGFIVREDVDLLVGWIFVVMQASAIGNVRILELEIDSIARAIFQSFSRQINAVLLELNFVFVHIFVVDPDLRDLLTLKVQE